MNYPDIKDAMYAPLEGISSDYFVPNLKLVPDNTISLLQTNQPFIEAYLAGLNHEFARELLWREYPTDQRGSYFRQFWDVSTYVDREQPRPEELAEDLKDIPPLHQWRRARARLAQSARREGRAHAGRVWSSGATCSSAIRTRSSTRRRRLGHGSAREPARAERRDRRTVRVAAAERSALRFPLYKARVAPDLHFVGFDLTLDEARGDPRLDETAAARAVVGDDLGWFFVLQEAVGEPRFGLDAERRSSRPRRSGTTSRGPTSTSAAARRSMSQAVSRRPAGADPTAPSGAATPPTWRTSSIRSRS